MRMFARRIAGAGIVALGLFLARSAEARDLLIPRSGTITKVEPGNRGLAIGLKVAPPLATGAGTIASVSTSSGDLKIVLTLGNGYEARYTLRGAFLPLVQPGEHVRARQKLARDENRGGRGELTFAVFARGRAVGLLGMKGLRVRGGAKFSSLLRAIAEARHLNPHLGLIEPAKTPTTGDDYRVGSSGGASVSIHELPPIEIKRGVRARPLLYTSSMFIDADGAGSAYLGDATGQSQTSLQSSSGRSLDPTQTPFFVLPLGFTARHAGVRLGDVGAILYNGRIVFAIFGDEGPSGQIGEASIAAARALGIDSNPNTGGVGGGVTYIVFPRSGDGQPLSHREIDRIGRTLLARAGGAP